MIPSSACPPWQPDQPGPVGEHADHAASCTTARDRIETLNIVNFKKNRVFGIPAAGT
jgi:hypothetical protein